MHPLPCNDPQELARQFNEDEAVWRCFEKKRLRRRLLGAPAGPFEKVLDTLDSLEAEREARPIRANGKWIAS